MTLVIEDGTGVTSSNTYVSDAEYVAYAAARGKTIGSDATAREIELIKAMDYIESHRDQFKGTKTEFDQSLQWPRHSVYIDGYNIASTSIPDELKNSQMEAAIVAVGTSLVPSGAVQNVKKQSLGPMSVEYFSGGSYESVQLDSVNIFLSVLLNASTSGITANVFRG